MRKMCIFSFLATYMWMISILNVVLTKSPQMVRLCKDSIYKTKKTNITVDLPINMYLQNHIQRTLSSILLSPCFALSWCSIHYARKNLAKFLRTSIVLSSAFASLVFTKCSCFGYALDLLVTVSSMHYCTSTSALSTSSSSRGLTNLTLWDISSWGGLHA